MIYYDQLCGRLWMRFSIKKSPVKKAYHFTLYYFFVLIRGFKSQLVCFLLLFFFAYSTVRMNQHTFPIVIAESYLTSSDRSMWQMHFTNAELYNTHGLMIISYDICVKSNAGEHVCPIWKKKKHESASPRISQHIWFTLCFKNACFSRL